jgi:hypothetical protein
MYLLGLAVAAVVASAVAVLVYRSSHRADDREWRRKWQRVPRSKRREITRAVRRGEAVRDPRDAQLALEVIDRIERQAARYQRRRSWWIELLLLVVEVALVASALVAALRRLDVGGVLSILLPVLLLATGAISFRLISRRQAVRRVQARRANEELVTVFLTGLIAPARTFGTSAASARSLVADRRLITTRTRPHKDKAP